MEGGKRVFQEEGTAYAKVRDLNRVGTARFDAVEKPRGGEAGDGSGGRQIRLG